MGVGRRKVVFEAGEALASMCVLCIYIYILYILVYSFLLDI